MFAPMSGKKINLRPLTAEDAESIRTHAKDREISEFTFIPHPYSIEHARRFLEYAEFQAMQGTGMHFGIEDKASGKIVGVVGLEGIDKRNRRAEIGYWIGKNYWHQGMASEAVLLVLGYCFKRLRLKRVYGHVFTGNIASERLLLRLGFTLEGVERSSRWGRGRYMDCILYSMLREEYRARSPRQDQAGRQ